MELERSLAKVCGAFFLLSLSVIDNECLNIILFLSIITFSFISSNNKHTFLYIAISPWVYYFTFSLWKSAILIVSSIKMMIKLKKFNSYSNSCSSALSLKDFFFITSKFWSSKSILDFCWIIFSFFIGYLSLPKWI